MAEKKTRKKKSEEAPKKRAPRAKKAVEPKAVETSALPEQRQEEIYKPRAAVKEAKPKFLPTKEYFESTGRRKTAIAHVYIYKGTGKIFVNSKPYEQYFCSRPSLLQLVLLPLNEINVMGQYDIQAQVFGGGISSQADAVRLGIARALVRANSENRKILRSLDLLKRDPRVKERKKYGLKRARRAFQFTKR